MSDTGTECENDHPGCVTQFCPLCGVEVNSKESMTVRWSEALEAAQKAYDRVLIAIEGANGPTERKFKRLVKRATDVYKLWKNVFDTEPPKPGEGCAPEEPPK